MESTEVVVAAALMVRLLAPLWMLRRPLPGMLAALGADILDGLLLEGMPGFDGHDKHPYDKPLDTYYLAIAYVVVLRGWTCPRAVRIARAFWCWRLAGLMAYLLTDDRLVFFLCPAAFEFFFLACESTRGRAAMASSSARRVGLLAVAAVALKLPQEYWLHVAQAPSTSFVTHHVLRADPATTRLQLAADHAMWLVLIAAVAAAAAAATSARRIAAAGRSDRSRLSPAGVGRTGFNGTASVEEKATAAVAGLCVALTLNALSTTTARPHPLAVGFGVAVACALVAALGGWWRSSA